MTLAIQIISTVVLARLLTPADFGLVTMVTTFSLLFMNFGGNGFTEAVLQREQIDHRLTSNLFWINFGAGVLLSAVFAVAGSLMARFYGNPLVAPVAAGMSSTILITSTSVLHLALLKRAMHFSAVAVNDIIARTLSVVVQIALAWAGWRYWALVIGAAVLPLSTSIGAWILCRWIPGLPRRVAGTGAMVRFAINIYGRFSVNYFARNLDNVLVGWRFNMHTLGFYKKAYDLFALPTGLTSAPLSGVAVSTLSRLDRNSGEYRRYILSALSVMAFVGMGLGADLTIVGHDLIRLLLGPDWAETGRIFTVFGPGIGVMLLYYSHGWIHLSIGRADRWFRWGLVEVAVTTLLLVAGLHWGSIGVASAWTASFWILMIPSLWYAGKPIQFGITSMLAPIWRFVVAALLAGCASAWMVQRMPSVLSESSPMGAFMRVVAHTALFGVLYISAVILLHRSCAPLYQVAGLVREMVPWGRVAEEPAAVIAAETQKSVMDKKPLVSILIPAFNAGEWIADSVRSAIAQTWENTEIIVVDDGSTDQTLAIARKFEADGVRVVTQKNQGAAAARNKAFSLSRGEYIQWLDADDCLAPDKISRQLEVLAECPSSRTLLSGPFGRFMYRRYRATFTPTTLWCDLTPVEWLLHKMRDNVFMQTATWLISRELTEAAGPWNTMLLGDDDGEYFCRVLLTSNGVRFVPDAKVYYRTPWFTSLGYIRRSDKKIEAHWRSMKLHIAHLRSLEDSERVRAACLEYLQTNFIHFYPERSGILIEAEQMARDLGGKLAVPRLTWKYRPIRMLFGWRLTKYLQQWLPRVRWSLQRFWDKVLYQIEKPRLTPSPANMRARAGRLQAAQPEMNVSAGES